MYINLDKNTNTVLEVIPTFNPAFPEVPIENRYPASFIANLIEVDDETKVYPGMTLLEDGTFVFIEPEIKPQYENIEEAKKAKIKSSKDLLKIWLEEHPLLYTDNKYYSVSEEKQALLNGNLSSYERAAKIGIEYPLKWNSTGEECTDWNYTNLLALSLSIAEYVAPRVNQQQLIELSIKACTTIEEVNNMEIKYE